jgi:catechol 2,3-dioxygenase-like lactoylglutathione lyase family enzyme
MSNFIRITPFMIVPDLDAALHFFVDILGFTLWLKADNYAYVQRETAAFRLLEQKDFDASYKRRYAYYIDVNDVDALYAELQLRLATLPDHHHHTPTDKPYGQREILICAPDGNLLAFGQSIHPMPGAVLKSSDEA